MTPRFRGPNRAAAIALAALFVLSACGRQPRFDEPPMAAAPMPAPVAESVSADLVRGRMAPTGDAAQAAPRRFLALKYELTVESDADAVERNWKAASQRCQEVQCEILSGGFSRDMGSRMPRASLRVRIAPEALPTFLKGIEEQGTVVASGMSSEDKTAEVVDTESRIVNMTGLRDRLRTMLSTRNAPLADVLAVERELAQVQSDLDTLAGLRKALADQTDKNEVAISFVARGSFMDPEKSSPLRRAWAEMGGVFMASLAQFLLVLAAVAPWLVIVLPLGWLLRRWLRRRRSRRAASQAKE